ncbi:MAG TPA: polyprenyl synthetase family protein [Candidatus Hydrogenedentes bacterium]|nr:polyprenyl synthetase family protein [Candidatus Hydrogenedentota bacterium]HOL77568.1 polyprenyl synthetase family protein [Candidatus Hydrogenedentota bacterium]HPO84873.1 polyprenyl synthetase family protein [Candidatus Hydrogenedentota bacterium]
MIELSTSAVLPYAEMTATDILSDIYEPIQTQVLDVRENLRRIQKDFLRLLDGHDNNEEVYSGGKLLRPALCLLSAGACGAHDLSDFVPMATAMETFHLGALAHDDVIDGANIRRGMSSLNARWSDHAAVLIGDYLIARGLSLLTPYNCPAVWELLAECLCGMAEGELHDLANGKNRSTFEQCIDLARAKTAGLFGFACCTPARVLNHASWEHFYKFGLKLGTAFQLIDDLLDLTKPQETLGKAPCNDLIRKKKTLPILLLKEALSATDQLRLESLSGNTLTKQEQVWVAALVVETGVKQRTEDIAKKLVQEALDQMNALPKTVFSERMARLAEFVVYRAF